MATRTLAAKLESSRLLIFNSRDASVAPLLENIGVDATYIEEGEALYNETMLLISNQKKEYQEQNLAYDEYYLEKDDTEAKFERTFKLVKALSQSDENLQNRIKIYQTKSLSIGAWIDYCIDFYDHLSRESQFLAKLEKFKFTADRLAEEKTAFENLKLLRNRAAAEKGEAQEATLVKNKKLEELEFYSKELKALAELALSEKPQLLEKLGFTVR